MEQLIKDAEAKVKYQFSVKEHPGKIDEVIARECSNEKVSIEEFEAGGRRREASHARARIALVLIKTHGLSLAEVARQRGVTTSAISRIISRTDQ